MPFNNYKGIYHSIFLIIVFIILVNQEKTIVILKLFEPASQLAPFCPEAPENYIKITFPHSLNGEVVLVLLTILHVDHLLRLNYRNNSIFYV